MTKSPMRVWYAIPSASIDRCREALPAWRDMGYRIAVLQNNERGEIPADLCDWADAYPGWAASVNLLARRLVAEGAEIVVTGGDDMLPDPTKRADELAIEFRDRFPNGFGVMQPAGDATMNAIEYCGSPWLGRAWIERAYGGRGPLWEGYRHNWADHELRLVAEARDALWTRPDLLQEHLHFSIRNEPAPEYWTRNVGDADQDDVELFIARCWQGFPGHGGPEGDRAEWRRRASVAERYWYARYGRDRLGDDGAMRRALQRCADEGRKRVLIYGAGSLTRSSGGALMSPPVRIEAIIDDDSRRLGERLWGYLVVDRGSAPDADAVILAARFASEAMRRRASELAPTTISLEETREAAHA